MLYISGLKTLLAKCSWLIRHPHLQRDAAEFLALPHTQTGERKAVRLLQGEVARFGLSKDQLIVGSDQARSLRSRIVILQDGPCWIKRDLFAGHDLHHSNFRVPQN